MSDANSLAGIVFYGGMNAGPSAGGWPCIQLLNPFGSGVNVYLDQAWIYQSDPGNGTTTGAWSIRLQRNDTPILNPVGEQHERLTNALLGGADSKSELRFYCRTPIEPMPVRLPDEIIQLEGGDGRTNGTVPVTFDDPIILGPDKGVMWVCTALNVLERVSFKIREIPL